MRVAYFYLMKDDPERVPAVVPQHVAYWRDRAPGGYLGGPFRDRSGGLITFEADSHAEAQSLVADDPFLGEGLLESSWLKEWVIE